MVNPYTQACPDHSTDEWAAMRTALVSAEHNSEEVVIEHLKDIWNRGNQKEREKWDQQVASDAACECQQQQRQCPPGQQQPLSQQQPPDQRQPPGPQQPPTQQQPPAQQEPDNQALGGAPLPEDPVDEDQPLRVAFIQLTTKTGRIPTVNQSAKPPDFADQAPAQVAIDKLSQMKFFLLWYFTAEGCAEAESSQRAYSDQAFDIIRRGDTIALLFQSDVQPSKKISRDEDLSWSQVYSAKPLMIRYMTKVMGTLVRP
ncbi:unnamed protein product [Somion occarium]|uniref:Uncharacterized protein n=1 Tax=Somion occarium TaxID=3059160 RepID=A0ABP1D7T1_9APHY